MARTAVPAALVHRADGTAAWYLLTGTVASTTYVPTRVELEASTTYDITKLMVAMEGFSSDVETTTVPMFGGGNPQTVDGAKTFEATALVTKYSTDGVDIRALIDPADTIYVAYFPAGDVPAQKMEVYKARVSNHMLPKNVTDFSRISTKLAQIDSNTFATVPALV